MFGRFGCWAAGAISGSAAARPRPASRPTASRRVRLVPQEVFTRSSLARVLYRKCTVRANSPQCPLLLLLRLELRRRHLDGPDGHEHWDLAAGLVLGRGPRP